jgi:hypothetical protein
MLLKLRTPGCVIIGALCVVLSVFEPVRWLPWDMLAAVVVCMVTMQFVLRQRVAAAEDFVPSRIATAEERGAQDALLRRYEQRAAERPGKLGDADRAAAAYIRRNRATLPEHSAVDDYDDGGYYEEDELQ